MGEWISVKDRLPEEEDREFILECIVTVMRTWFPASSYDIIKEPYEEIIVTTARYDERQKIWHLSWDECLNALMDTEDSPLNGAFVTHWMPLPEPPKED